MKRNIFIFCCILTFYTNSSAGIVQLAPHVYQGITGYFLQENRSQKDFDQFINKMQTILTPEELYQFSQNGPTQKFIDNLTSSNREQPINKSPIPEEAISFLHVIEEYVQQHNPGQLIKLYYETKNPKDNTFSFDIYTFKRILVALNHTSDEIERIFNNGIQPANMRNLQKHMRSLQEFYHMQDGLLTYGEDFETSASQDEEELIELINSLEEDDILDFTNHITPEPPLEKKKQPAISQTITRLSIHSSVLNFIKKNNRALAQWAPIPTSIACVAALFGIFSWYNTQTKQQDANHS